MRKLIGMKYELLQRIAFYSTIVFQKSRLLKKFRLVLIESSGIKLLSWKKYFEYYGFLKFFNTTMNPWSKN